MLKNAILSYVWCQNALKYLLFSFKIMFFYAFSPQKSSKCNELITTHHVIGNMKNRIFCYEKTIETKKTRKNALKTQCFNTFAYKNNQKITKTMQILHAIRRREAARFGN